MKPLRYVLAFVLLCSLTGTLLAQRYYAPIGGPLRGEATEWVFARLAYSGSSMGYSQWNVDYPMAERHFSEAVGRLTLLDPHESGHVVQPSSDELFDYPWLYAVEAWSWSFTAEEAARMREYLMRGGFLMVDDFHGESEWQLFQRGMKQIFPTRPIEDIPEGDVVYAMPYAVVERHQVPGPNYMWTGVPYERYDGVEPHWRGIRDDKGRWMVAISHNIDYGEGWEQADTPQYPEEFTRQAYEVGIDYLIYSMTH